VTEPVGPCGPPKPPDPTLIATIRRRAKRETKRVITAVSKRSTAFRKVSRAAFGLKRSLNYRNHYNRHAVNERMVIFESFMGRGYSDSPKALYKAMLADPRYNDFTFVWAFRRPLEFTDDPEFERAHLVRYGSQDYYAVYSQAKYWISNSRIPDQIVPKPEQVYVQTWHGTPLKRLGFDIQIETANALHSTRELQERYAIDARRYAHMLSPSAFATDKFRSAFCLSQLHDHDIIVEEGYPRNDALFALGEDDVARIRERLGVPQGKKTVLYAPTWRDDQHVSGMGYTLALPVDFDRLQRDLGDEYVILFRAHYFIANEFDFERYAGFVIDVSGVDDINELYVASDMLVTDYSSVFFDYANLKRPIVFYMYDLEAYAHDLRGFYLDLDELPGPIVRTEDELVSALRTAHAPDEELAARYHRFNERFTYLDDGHASERVIERVIGVATCEPSVSQEAIL